MELLYTFGGLILLLIIYLYWRFILIFFLVSFIIGGLIWLAVLFPFLWVVYGIIIALQILVILFN